MNDFEKLLHILMEAEKEEKEGKEGKEEKENAAKEASKKTYEIYSELCEAGFNEEQAFELLTIFIENALW